MSVLERILTPGQLRLCLVWAERPTDEKIATKLGVSRVAVTQMRKRINQRLSVAGLRELDRSELAKADYPRFCEHELQVAASK